MFVQGNSVEGCAMLNPVVGQSYSEEDIIKLVKDGRNIVVIGDRLCGKTTFVNKLSNEIKDSVIFTSYSKHNYCSKKEVIELRGPIARGKLFQGKTIIADEENKTHENFSKYNMMGIKNGIYFQCDDPTSGKNYDSYGFYYYLNRELEKEGDSLLIFRMFMNRSTFEKTFVMLSNIIEFESKWPGYYDFIEIDKQIDNSPTPQQLLKQIEKLENEINRLKKNNKPTYIPYIPQQPTYPNDYNPYNPWDWWKTHPGIVWCSTTSDNTK